MPSAHEILRVLDRGATAFVFPALDNGYVYLAATRMSLHCSTADWALVFEVFGFSPRAGLPDLSVWTFGNRLRDRNSPKDYVSPEAYLNYLAKHPNDDCRFFHPISEGDWQDPESVELVSGNARSLHLRDHDIDCPQVGDFADANIALSASPRIQTFELCRFLAAKRRDSVLATPEERRVSVPEGLAQVLVLDEWRHPDLVNGERPSDTETFVQLAEVLASGDVTKYVPHVSPNTDWRFWPEGGIL